MKTIHTFSILFWINRAKEKDGKLTEDEKFKAKDELQKIIDEVNRSLETSFEKKQKEVMR